MPKPAPRYSRAKIITVGEYGIRFEQRGRGEETPYWQGSIFDKAGLLIGTFSNGGTGGMTTLNPHRMQGVLNAAVDAATPDTLREKVAANPERYDLVFYCAEVIGYTRGAQDITLTDYIRISSKGADYTPDRKTG
jgi:hypothetical protein